MDTNAAGGRRPVGSLAGRVFEVFCWLVTLLACTGGALRLWELSLSRTASAPQYAAEAAGVCAMVLVPYVFSRAVKGLRQI